MKRAVILVLLMLASLLVACQPSDSPEKAAREWVEASLNYDGNKMAQRTCTALQEELQNQALLLSAFAALGQMYTGQQTQGDISELHFETLNRSGDTAQVRVTGEIHVAVLAFSQAEQVDETWRMIREDGKWKWCGLADIPIQ
ncbi:MAG: hypothetical protein ABFD20_06200 [Anaerolineales bacterium]